MFFRPVYVAIIIALFIIVIMTTSFDVNYVPYSKPTLFAREFPYEGFSNNQQQQQQSAQLAEGFAGLQSAPFAGEQMLDKFANTDASANCMGSGLTNSKGSLCLSNEQKQLLSTRGGNATGLDAQIGASPL
jgi:hypothetical protein